MQLCVGLVKATALHLLEGRKSQENSSATVYMLAFAVMCATTFAMYADHFDRAFVCGLCAPRVLLVRVGSTSIHLAMPGSVGGSSTRSESSLGDALVLSEAGELASQLERQRVLRERLREKGHFTRWPSLACTGIPSVKAMGMNSRLLETLADWWCPMHRGPTCLSIDLCRREAPTFVVDVFFKIADS